MHKPVLSSLVSSLVLAVAVFAVGACGKIPDSSGLGDVDAGGGPCGTAVCDPNATCTDAITGSCECNDGYEGSGTTCTDVNECEGEGGDALCSANATCMNTSGSFNCECNGGYRDDGTGQCEDIDECEVSTNCPANADCINEEGTFACPCRFGYLPDGGECKSAWREILNTSDFAIDEIVVLGSRLYVLHEGSVGTSTFVSYDPVLSDLRTENAMLADFCACGYGGVLVAADASIYHFAGDGNRYLPGTQTWQVRAYPENIRQGEMIGAALGDSLYYFGGRDDVLNVRRFYRTANIWQVLGSTFPGGGEPLSVGVTDRELFLYSVRLANNEVVPSMWRMDLSNLTPGAVMPTVAWQQMPDGPGVVRYGSGVFHGGRLRFVVDGPAGTAIASFNPQTELWESLAPIPETNNRGYLAVIEDRLYYASTNNFDFRLDIMQIE